MIVNDKTWLIKLDSRIRSRLLPEVLEFNAYNEKETLGILKKRTEFAFVPNSFSKEALELISKKAYEVGDIRLGIHLLKESGLISEEESSKKILEKHSLKAVKEIKDEDNSLLDFIKKNPNLNSSKLHEMFNTDVSYKTFRRQLERLEKANMISLEQKSEGIHGKVTIVKLREEKSLDSF